MDEEKEKENEPRFVGIPVITKGKRVLLHLGDFFIVFILSLLLFHVGVYPLGRVIVDYPGQMDSLHVAQTKRDGVLYGMDLLFPVSESATGYEHFEESLTYTSDQFVHTFVDSAFNQKYNVFANYFVDIYQEKADYIDFFKTLDAKTSFFDFTGEKVALKKEYVDEFAAKYNPDDTMSEKGLADFQTFEDKIFAQGYSRMLNDIMKRDLVLDGVSYQAQQNIISRVLNDGRMLVVSCSVISFLLVWLVNHLLIPTFSKKRKTLAMMLLRTERIHRNTYEPLSIPMAYIASIYALAGEMLCVLFVPWGITNFNELFSLPLLFPLALISLAYILGSLAVTLFDAYNRTLGDLLCNSYVLTADGFDTLVREKGIKA